jgi:ElaB/YqjD/DUF883 family membrane-anchored ribosome-binding protein
MTDERDGTQEEPEVEEAFVRALGDAARKLWNAPPETPREEMWNEIRAARAGEVVDRETSSRRLPRPKPWWLGIAAALAIGIVLGRVSDEPIGSQTGGTPAVADAGPATAPTTGPAAESITTPGAESGSETPSEAALLPYRFATTELLNRSETFLTMVRAGGAAEESADEVREWARPLLTRTRLLLGSPAAADPELRSLLDDLEIVLVQIAQLPEDDSEERGWIDEGMDESRLLFRLRAASAAGAGTVRM